MSRDRVTVGAEAIMSHFVDRKATKWSILNGTVVLCHFDVQIQTITRDETTGRFWLWFVRESSFSITALPYNRSPGGENGSEGPLKFGDAMVSHFQGVYW
jgi:hypothetical protein